MATRTAHTTWSGGLQDGSGTVELVSSGVGSFPVSFPRRIGDNAEGVTSPEELIAAAHCACYAMAFSNMLGEAGGTNTSLSVQADVAIGPDPAGGLMIPSIRLTVRGSSDGVDADTFVALAEQAKVGCPVSKALAGTDITLDAAAK